METLKEFVRIVLVIALMFAAVLTISLLAVPLR